MSETPNTTATDAASRYDLVIVGGGMVGATLAAALGESPLRILVLERQCRGRFEPGAGLTGYDPRVSALTLASEQILRRLGAWRAMTERRVSPYRRMQVWDGEGTGSIRFEAAALHLEHLGHIVENGITLGALHARLASLPAVTWRAPAEVAALDEPARLADERFERRRLALSDGTEVWARLVVAADGALSPTRRLAHFPMWEWDYGHQAVVGNVRTAQPHQQTAWQRFTDQGPLAFLPLPDPHCCSIVWSTTPEQAQRLIRVPAKAFCQALGRAFEYRLGEVEAVAERFSFVLRQRHAHYYVKPGMALVGDAAHTLHPLAGQGVNLGLLDAACLAEVLQEGLDEGRDIGELALLRRFQRRRRGENLLMAAAMEGFKRLFEPQPPVIQWLRSAGLETADRVAPLKRELVRHATGLAGALPALARVGACGPRE